MTDSDNVMDLDRAKSGDPDMPPWLKRDPSNQQATTPPAPSKVPDVSPAATAPTTMTGLRFDRGGRNGRAYVFTDGITIGDRMRPLDEERVAVLAESMKTFGLQHPITVWSPDDYTTHLVAGRHRLAAAIKLGWDQIDCVFVWDADEIDRQILEIVENLHRVDLTKEQRDKHLRRYAELLEARATKLALQTANQDKPVKKQHGGHNKKIASEIAKATGLHQTTVARAIGQIPKRPTITARFETEERLIPAIGYPVSEKVESDDDEEEAERQRVAKLSPAYQKRLEREEEKQSQAWQAEVEKIRAQIEEVRTILRKLPAEDFARLRELAIKLESCELKNLTEAPTASCGTQACATPVPAPQQVVA